MKKEPTYSELKAENEMLRQKLHWLKGVYHEHRDAGEQIRSRFLSHISHQLRTPINSIVGFSELLEYENLTRSERLEYIQYITYNSRSLMNVMDNIIDLTLLETNSEELNKNNEEVCAEDVLREIYDYYNARVVRSMNYRTALLMKTPENHEKVVLNVDSYRLYRILDNLVNTAITQQSKGVVEMKMEILNEERIIFSIISNKNELLEERAKMIFENNGENDDWYNHLDFTGLAFKLARDLAKAMGGFVSLLQVDGKRTGISIELPIKSVGSIKQKIA